MNGEEVINILEEVEKEENDINNKFLIVATDIEGKNNEDNENNDNENQKKDNSEQKILIIEEEKKNVDNIVKNEIIEENENQNEIIEIKNDKKQEDDDDQDKKKQIILDRFNNMKNNDGENDKNDKNNKAEIIEKIDKNENNENKENKENDEKQIIINIKEDVIQENNEIQIKDNNLEKNKNIKNENNEIQIKENNLEKNKNIQNENNEKVINIKLLLEELKKKDEIIEKMQNEIKNINEELIKIKENDKKNIKLLKNYFEKDINSIKEEIESIKKNNNDEAKDNKKNQIRKRDFDLMKEDIRDLTDKCNNFERVFENKLYFIESSLSKLLNQEEEKKMQNNINEKKINENKINENKIDENKINENKINENKINENKINENKIDENKNNDIINNKAQNIWNIKDEDEGIWKDFIAFLDIQFSEKKAKHKEIKKTDLEKFKKIALNLKKKGKLTEEKFTEYYKEKIELRKHDEKTFNLLNKKNQIYEVLNNLDSNLNQKKEEGGFFGFKNKGHKTVNIKKFDIKKFRKEYNLSEAEFPDKELKQKYIDCNGDLQLTFCKLVNLK